MVGGVAQERGPGDSRRTSGLLGFSVPVTLSPNWEIGCSKYPWPLKSLPCRVRRKLKGARVGPSQVLGLGGVSSCLAQTAALGMHSLCFRVSHCLHLELLHWSLSKFLSWCLLTRLLLHYSTCIRPLLYQVLETRKISESKLLSAFRDCTDFSNYNSFLNRNLRSVQSPWCYRSV